MKPVENFEAEQQKREKEFLASKVGSLTEEEKLKIYEQGIRSISQTALIKNTVKWGE